MRLDYADLIGKPYRPDAWGPDAFDCFSLLAEVLARLGLSESLPVRLRDAIRAGRAVAIEDLADDWEQIKHPHALGDIALTNGDPTAPSHCAIHVGSALMLHTTETRGAHTVPWRVLRPFCRQLIRLRVRP